MRMIEPFAVSNPSDGAAATPSEDRTATDLTASVATWWGLLLVLGVVTVAAGTAVIAWPGLTLIALAVLLGMWLLASGALRLTAAVVDKDLGTGARIVEGLIGALLVAAGIACLTDLVRSLAALVTFMGLFFIVDGVGDLITAVAGRNGRSQAWPAISGVLGITAGLIVLSRPNVGLVGVARIAVALGLRRWLAQ